jgi:hypothetical protein
MTLGNISPVTQKLLVGGVLFAAWSYLVYTGKVPATDYVENIKIGLGGLRLYHVVTNSTAKKADDSSAPPAA